MSEIEAQAEVEAQPAEPPVEAQAERRTSVDDHHDEKIKEKVQNILTLVHLFCKTVIKLICRF